MPKQYLAWPSYVVGALLVLVPLSDAVLSIWPFRPGEVSWRFGAFGVTNGALMTPLVGLLTVFAAALLLGHHRVLRTLSVLCGVGAVVLLLVSGLFVLDAVQMRAQVGPDARRAFDVASARVLARALLISGALATFLIAGWRAARKRTRSVGHDVEGTEAAPPILVRVGR